MKKLIPILLVFVALTGCKNANAPDAPGGDSGQTGEVVIPTVDATIQPYSGTVATDRSNDVIDSSNDSIYWEANSWDKDVVITYSSAGADIQKSSDDIVCYNDGAHVVVDLLTNSVKGVKITIQGTSADGSLKIYGEKKFVLVLNGVDLTSTRGPVINNQCHKRMFLQVNDSSTNRMTDAASYGTDAWYHSSSSAEDEDRRGCIFSEGDIIMSGYGSLVVAGKAKNGIATDNYYYQRPGVTVVVNEAASHAIKAKGNDGLGIYIAGGYIYANVASTAGKCLNSELDITIAGGTLDLNTTGGSEYDSDDQDTSSPSCIKSDGNTYITGGTISCKSSGQGGKGINADGNLVIDDGNIAIATTGGQYQYNRNLTSSPKGIRVDGDITINGGVIAVSVSGSSEGSEGIESKANIYFYGGKTYVYAYDDAVNAATSITVDGGWVYGYGANNDGIDSNGKLYIKSGIAIAAGCREPEEGFDADNSNNFIITGGIVIGTGGGSMNPPSSSSTQNVVVYSGLNATKDQLVAILDASGNIVMVYRLPRTLSGMGLVVSTPKFTQGSSYTIYSGGSLTGEGEEVYGYFADGTYSNGTSLSTFTISQTVTNVGNGGGGQGGGGGDPGGGGGGGGHGPH